MAGPRPCRGLLAIGIALIAFKTELPGWLENGAEKAVGVVIILLALRVAVKSMRGDCRAASHGHDGGEPATPRACAICARVATSTPTATSAHHQAFTNGILHGLAGTGPVALLLIAALPTQVEAIAALAVFAPMSVLSMALCTTAFARGSHAAGDRAALPDGVDSVPWRLRG